jgi:MtN3 and saliva related transmembrane protein
VRGGSALALMLSVLTLCGCEELAIRDMPSLFVPGFQHSEVVGIVAGLGTTCAALPDLITMFKRHSSSGMNPTMAAIMGIFQIVWVYYGLLIVSRPVVVWNVIAIVINLLSVWAYYHFRAPKMRGLRHER